MKRLLLALVALSAPLAAQDGRGPFTVAETGRSFYRLQDAVNAIGERDGQIMIAPGVWHDCATQSAGRVAYRAAGEGVVFDGGTCEGKAALVLHGRDAVVENITFQNMRVPDRNGAGIRLEKGNLTVLHSTFRDSEEGILTADDPASTIRVDHSTFAGLGRCDGYASCAHGIYVGDYGALTVTNSRFERGNGGHYLKSRAARIEVTDSSFDDTRGHTTNYMIDLPAGAVGTITGNHFAEGTDKENHSAVVAVAAEQRIHPSAGLVVANNQASLAPNTPWKTVFVADWSHEPLRLGANRLGPGITPFEQRN